MRYCYEYMVLRGHRSNTCQRLGWLPKMLILEEWDLIIQLFFLKVIIDHKSNEQIQGFLQKKESENI